MPTRHGWAMVVAAAASIVIGRLFGLLELFVVGVALFVAFGLAVLVVNRPLPRIDVRRIARPTTVSVGEPARVDLQVANRSHTNTPRLKLWEPVGNKGGAPMQLAPLRAGEAVSAAYRVPTSRRGVLRTGPLRAERTDPLGLCKRVTWLAGAGEVLVVPERVPLAVPGTGSSGRLGQHLRMKAFGQTGSEFHSQREYAIGDDLRRINWKSSARAGTLIVRETAMEGIQRCVVVLDTCGAGYDEDGFERAVTAAASVVAATAAGGIATRLVSPGIDLRGPDVAPQSLRWLATVQTGEEIVDHTASGRTAIDGLGLLVVVTNSASSRAAANAISAAGPDEAVVVVATMAPSAGGKGFHVDATSLEHLHHSWNQLVLGRTGALT
jgi:uncharacterized protein (DUF58 family)